MHKFRRLIISLSILALMMSGCTSLPDASVEQSSSIPVLPDKLALGDDGIPVLDVFDISTDRILRMNLEDYVTGVVAGEMKNDWPMEALKAQAILARTFVLKFCSTKQSSYQGADISTDVSEAQAYAPDNINDRVRQAVKETQGIVMSADGDYPYSWFFAHAGGHTELPTVALDYQSPDPSYTSATASPDSEKAPDDVENWTVTFKEEEILAASRALGLNLNTIESVEAGEKGISGRLKTLLINGQAISAPSFRIKIGANKLKSTLIRDITLKDGSVTFRGSGFGHGVGMSQWGAYELADQGKAAEEIIQHYFQNISIVRMW